MNDEPSRGFADRITAAWHRHIDAILETADLLLQAKKDLDHGQFTAMINDSLPFGPDVAQRLMAIGRHTALRKAAQDRLLPGRWTTLFELSRLPDSVFEAALADGRVTPQTTRAEAAAIRLPIIQTPPQPPFKPVQIQIVHSPPPPPYEPVRIPLRRISITEEMMRRASRALREVCKLNRDTADKVDIEAVNEFRTDLKNAQKWINRPKVS
jgi:hypothetical protein